MISRGELKDFIVFSIAFFGSTSLVGVMSHYFWKFPQARHIYPSLVLVQPRKTRPCLTERLLMGRKESNQTKQTNKLSVCKGYQLTTKFAASKERVNIKEPFVYVLFFKFSWYFLLLLFSALDEGDIALLKTYVSTMHVHRFLCLPERL